MHSLEWLGSQEADYIASVRVRAIAKLQELYGLPFNPEFKKRAEQFIVEMPLQAIGFCPSCTFGLCGHCGKCHSLHLSLCCREPCPLFEQSIPEEWWEWEEAYIAI